MSRARLRHVIAETLVEGDAGDRAEGGESRETTSDEAFMKAFGFIPLTSKISAGASARLQGDALVGLYVPRERAIYVRPRTRTSSAIDRDDVLHELEHALQDDLFGMAAMDAPGNEDARLARRAVYEGDATVVAWGVAGMRAGGTAEAAIAEHRLGALAQSATLGVAQELEAIPGWSGVPRITQVELFFPYSAGSELVAEAFLAGGPALMDGLFRKLPVSTEQVLHAAKYFNGEAPIPVGAPPVPPGFVVRASGTMGELRTRAFLELALPAAAAVSASAGWGGDSYTIASRGETGPLAVLWSTVWDDEDHASRFAAALTEAFPSDKSTLGSVAIRRQGTRVAWTRGVDGTGLLDPLLALPGEKPHDDPPFGQVVLPSTQVIHAVIVPAGGDPHLLIPALGVAAHLPPRFARIQSGSSDLAVQQIEQHGRGDVAHEARGYDAPAFAQLAATIAPVFAVTFPLGKAEIRAVTLPMGEAREARWPFDDGSGEARFIAIPLCGGAQTMFVTTVARSEEARVALRQWVRSLAPIDSALPPVCR